MSLPEVGTVVDRMLADARADERKRVGLWLEQQAVTSRQAPSGVHPEAATRTHAAAFIWAAARVLADDI